jgi:hypothetical protein
MFCPVTNGWHEIFYNFLPRRVLRIVFRFHSRPPVSEIIVTHFGGIKWQGRKIKDLGAAVNG